MPELAYLNGEIMPIEKAFIPIEDRGYQFGDAVYEYIASHDGKLFFTEDHLTRLKRTLNELLFPAISMTLIKTAIFDLFEASQIKRAGIYIQISRAVAPRNHCFSNKEPLQIVMTCRSLPQEHPQAKTGVKVITMEDFRWGRCDLKTVQILPNSLCKQKAVDQGVYDTIFISNDKIVREATSSNVFIIKDKKILTHPLTNNILPGVTRKIVLEICKKKGVAFKECFYNLKDLYDADEVFLSGTVTEILPVIAVDNKTIKDKKPGSITKKLYKELCIKSGVKVSS